MNSVLSFYYSTESEVDAKLFLKANNQNQKNSGMNGGQSYDSAILRGRQFSAPSLVVVVFFLQAFLQLLYKLIT